MTVQILAFGRLKEIVDTTTLDVAEAIDTDQLQEMLQTQFPALKNLKYALAVNQQVVNQNTAVPQHAMVALLPPFSGG